MQESEYIIALRSKVMNSQDLDYDGEFGHVVREYFLQLPNGSSCQSFICSDEYAPIPEEEQHRQLDELWKVAQTMYGRSNASQ